MITTSTGPAVQTILVQTLQNHVSNINIWFGVCRDYACISFLSVQRMDFSSSRLAELTFDDFAQCSIDLMKGWTLGSQQGPVVQKIPVEPQSAGQEGTVSEIRAWL